jgi:hypothetical protein
MIQSIEDGRREAGDRSIADKIIKRLHDLEKTVENNQGRWAWELLQNAKDSIAEEDRTVSVQIQLDKESVEFRHNGTHFSDQDVIGLISQISSKEVEEGQQTNKTGRFGTGFLTTHLLSKVIKIKGILEDKDRNLHKFEFSLDRRGKTTTQLMPQISNSWSEFRESVVKIDSNYDRENFNTSFSYQLETEEQRKIAKVGIEEFLKLIPYVLAFIPKISKIEIIDNLKKYNITYKNRELIEDFVVHISKVTNNEETDIYLLYASDDKVAIATEVDKNEIGYSVKSIRDFPKLFCDFPLIGTENFYFPVVINSFFFNPQTERDGIWLKGINDPEVKENQLLLEKAVNLFQILISRLVEANVFDLYNLSETRMPSTDGRSFYKPWYKDAIQKKIRELIYNSKIVETEDKALEKEKIKSIFFPINSYSQEDKERIWQFIFDLSPRSVCKKDHLHNWCNLSWEEWNLVDYQKLLNLIASRENISSLSNDLEKTEKDTCDWLNSFGEFIIEDDKNSNLLDKNSIIPNKNCAFKERKSLYIDKIDDDDLIEVLRLLGEDWRDILLHQSIKFGTYGNKDKKDIAGRITTILRKPDETDNTIKAINLLSEWFENNPELGDDLFSDLYNKRAELFMNTIQDKESLYKVMRTCTDLSQLAEIAQIIEGDSEIVSKLQNTKDINSLLEEFKANNVSDLRNILSQSKDILDNASTKTEITQETLLSLGVTSISQLEEALQDKDVADKFVHTSSPSVEMFLAVQELIDRAKNNVIKHLRTLANYDCADLEELAPTVIGGVKKDGLPIFIVVRPSDNGVVIVFYSSEKDTLDDPNSELWIDNNIVMPKRLTIGKILKATGINRIPVN